MKSHFLTFATVVVLVSAACGGSNSEGDAGGGDGAVQPDASIDAPIVDSAPDAPGNDAPSPQDAKVKSDAGPVSCGGSTCGINEYCLHKCTCCGIPFPDGGGPPQTATDECKPLPTTCANDFCSCPEVKNSGGFCDAPKRTLSVPCA